MGLRGGRMVRKKQDWIHVQQMTQELFLLRGHGERCEYRNVGRFVYDYSGRTSVRRSMSTVRQTHVASTMSRLQLLQVSPLLVSLRWGRMELDGLVLFTMEFRHHLSLR